MARSHGFFADLHTHTLASSHAYSTVTEYAQFAASEGVRMFAVTDHGPALGDAPHPWHFSNQIIIPRMLHGVAVMRGIEANILEGGEYYPLDMDRETLTVYLDIVLAGFHTPCQMPLGKEENTRLMVETIESGLVHIISHPGNPQFPIDIRAVSEAAVRCNVALEINNSSFLTSRKGSKTNCLEIARVHKEMGGVIALGSDSHHCHSLGDFTEALKVVESTGFPMERIINTSPERVLDFLEEHGKDFSDIRAMLS